MKDLLDSMGAKIIYREVAHDQRVGHVEARRVEPGRVAKVRWADDIVDGKIDDEDTCEVEKVFNYAWAAHSEIVAEGL